jgi:hypothetical protein
MTFNAVSDLICLVFQLLPTKKKQFEFGDATQQANFTVVYEVKQPPKCPIGHFRNKWHKLDLEQLLSNSSYVQNRETVRDSKDTASQIIFPYPRLTHFEMYYAGKIINPDFLKTQHAVDCLKIYPFYTQAPSSTPDMTYQDYTKFVASVVFLYMGTELAKDANKRQAEINRIDARLASLFEEVKALEQKRAELDLPSVINEERLALARLQQFQNLPNHFA